MNKRIFNFSHSIFKKLKTKKTKLSLRVPVPLILGFPHLSVPTNDQIREIQFRIRTRIQIRSFSKKCIATLCMLLLESTQWDTRTPVWCTNPCTKIASPPPPPRNNCIPPPRNTVLYCLQLPVYAVARCCPVGLAPTNHRQQEQFTLPCNSSSRPAH